MSALWWRAKYCPVSKVARLIQQTLVVTQLWVNRIPSRANWSRKGVRTIWVPTADNESCLQSSGYRTRTFILFSVSRVFKAALALLSESCTFSGVWRLKDPWWYWSTWTAFDISVSKTFKLIHKVEGVMTKTNALKNREQTERNALGCLLPTPIISCQSHTQWKRLQAILSAMRP